VTGGLGWRVWRAALVLCDFLCETPALVAGKRVLEVGAGCGACGLLAAACGARDTVLTDCFEGLLDALAENISLNAEPSDDASRWTPRVSTAGGGTLTARHLDWELDAAAPSSTNGDEGAAPRLAPDELLPVPQTPFELRFLPTMVLAPSGAGKSTLLAKAAREASTPADASHTPAPVVLVRVRQTPSVDGSVQSLGEACCGN
jgi:hypothetical protein